MCAEDMIADQIIVMPRFCKYAGHFAIIINMSKVKKMKTIIVNGSPRNNGNCAKVAELFAAALEKEGIETELLQIGSMDISGCRGCWACAKTGRCVQDDAAFHEAAEKIYEADGLFIAAPVYYDSMPGQLKSFLDRLFFQDRGGGGLRRKVGAACSVQRRTGGVALLDDIYHFLICAGMIIAPSEGESMVFGLEPGEVMADQEGLDILEGTAGNMAWLMRMMETTKEILPPPELKKRAQTNFIR